jgi:arsenate reductase-like glutaredoxin family protein
MAEYRAKQISRDELEAWLTEQDDEAEIRKLFNGMRG